MAAEIATLLDADDGHALTITGVRLGESAVRDARIGMSCSRDGGECGQGWYQTVLPESKGVRGRIATLAPMLHWRVCHVWDWLRIFAPGAEYGAWPTGMLADAYGGEEATEIDARTGCIGCPLAARERALDTILRMPQWQYLQPLRRLHPLYRRLREPDCRLRKPGTETLRDGSMAANPQRMGPLTFDARLMGLDTVLEVQDACDAGRPAEHPPLDILSTDEQRRIRELIAARTWPDGWTGDEPRADEWLSETIHRDGVVQMHLD